MVLLSRQLLRFLLRINMFIYSQRGLCLHLKKLIKLLPQFFNFLIFFLLVFKKLAIELLLLLKTLNSFL